MNRTKQRVPLWFRSFTAVGAALVFMQLASLLVMQPFGVLTILPLVAVPALVLTLVGWSDLHRVGQRHLYRWAFLLGSGWVAATALVINTVASVVVGEITVIVAGAPILEEVLKALAVFLVLRVGRQGVVTLHSGAAVGALLGAGFAFAEDASFALSSDDPLMQMVFRMFFGPFFHASTGALFGLAYAMRSMTVTSTVLSASIVLHVAWNTMAQLAVSVPVALTFSALLSMAFTWGWVSSHASQRRQVESLGDEAQGLLPIEHELLRNPDLVDELAVLRKDLELGNSLIGWKRATAHVLEGGTLGVERHQARQADLQKVRKDIYGVLSERCQPGCHELQDEISEHHFDPVHLEVGLPVELEESSFMADEVTGAEPQN